MFRKTLKMLSYLLLMLTLCAITMIVIVSLQDPNRYKTALIDSLNQAYSTNLSVQGKIEYQWWPKPTIVMNQLILPFNVSNQQGQISAEKAKLGLSFSALLAKDPSKANLEIEGLIVSVDDKQGNRRDNNLAYLSVNLERNERLILINNIEIKEGGIELQGQAQLDLQHERPFLKGSFSSSKFNFNYPEKTDKKSSSSSSTTKSPFILNLADWLDSELSLSANEFSINTVNLKNVLLNIKSNQGKSVLEISKATWLQGNLTAQLSAEPTANKRYQFQTLVKLENAKIDKLLPVRIKQGGDFRFVFKGNKEARDLQTASRHWDGSFFWHLSPTHFWLPQESKPSFAVGLLKALNPLAKPKLPSEVSCAVARFKLKDGQAVSIRQIASESPNLKVVGSGLIYLPDESLDLEFELIPSQTTLLPSDKTKFVKVAGTFSKPEFSLGPKSLLAESASLLSAIATSGLSLVAEQVIEGFNEEEKPCQKLLNEDF
jgi:hypothetical protein